MSISGGDGSETDHGRIALLDVPGIDVERDHEAVRTLGFELVVPASVGFDLGRHQDKTIVPRRGEILEIFDHRRLRTHGRSVVCEYYLTRLARVEPGHGMVLAAVPLDRGIRTHRERLPLPGVDRAQKNGCDAIALRLR